MKKPFYEKKSAAIMSLLLPAAGVLLIAGSLFLKWYSFYLKVEKVSHGGFSLWEVMLRTLKNYKNEFMKGDVLPPLFILVTVLLVFYFGYLILRRRYDFQIGVLDKLYDNFRVVSYVIPALYILLAGYLFMMKNYKAKWKDILNRQMVVWLYVFFAIALLWMLLISLRPLLPEKSAFLRGTIDRFRLISRIFPLAILVAFWRLVQHIPGYEKRMADMMELKVAWQDTIKRYKESGIGGGMKCALRHGLGFWMFFLGMTVFVFGLCYKYVVDTLNEDRVAEEEREAMMAAKLLKEAEEAEREAREETDEKKLAGLSGEETADELEKKAEEILQDYSASKL